jgi:signal transduction histidine kinase
MYQAINRFVDWFIPSTCGDTASEKLMARTFVLLHMLGPIMGHSVTWFLSQTPAVATWQFWVTELLVTSFLFIPIVLKLSRNLDYTAMLSAQMLVFLSLFGSYYFGGISSPFIPWFLIAMGLGFFYLASRVTQIIIGVAIQLMAFAAARIVTGQFPELLPIEELQYANLLSIAAALAYMTLLCLYYEQVMRNSSEIEIEATTQRQKLATLREAMEGAEQASKRKSIFLAKMSHELRTPLNAVIGYTEMLRENYEENGSDEQKMTDLDRIRAAGRHLLALVDDVIDVSSVEANKLQIIAAPVVMAELIDEVVSTATPLVHKRDNKLIIDMPEDLGTLALDALKVRQSILNLLSNAAKFTTKGSIMLSVRKLEKENGEDLHISVHDNGIGMTREGMNRLFSEFSQAESDIVDRFGGTGLGLALTKRFCLMMGGDISVESQRGIGTTFTIKIPIKQNSPQRREILAAA